MLTSQVSGVKITLNDRHCKRPRSGRDRFHRAQPHSRRLHLELQEEDGGWRLPEDAGHDQSQLTEEGGRRKEKCLGPG